MTRILALALCFVSAATVARAQASDAAIAGGTASIDQSGARAPSDASGEVAGVGNSAMVNGHSNIGDRRTLDDLKAGTSGSTQTR